MNAPVLAVVLLFAAEAPTPAGGTSDRPTVLVVVGAEGIAEYGEAFRSWAGRWQAAAERAGASLKLVGLDPPGGTTDLQTLQALLAEEPKESAEPLWLVLIGHGTFDGNAAKFNLRGPDVAAAELGRWLSPFTKKRTVAVINCASSSAPFVNRLSAAGRVVVTATKSGYELNYARFGDYFSAAMADGSGFREQGTGDRKQVSARATHHSPLTTHHSSPAPIPDLQADLDKDSQTSLLEAFLWASGRVAEFYREEGRLATETALVDDNGDGQGTPASFFRGTRVVRRPKKDASPDGALAHQLHLVRSAEEERMPPQLRARRDELERAIEALRASKDDQTDLEAYYTELEPLLLELARLYKRADKQAGAP